MNKKNLIERLIINLQREAEEIKKSFESAREAAIAAPGAMQSKSDTTKFQMSKLVESYFNTYQQIQRGISVLGELDPSKNYQVIEVGAIVKVEKNQSKDYYFLLPSEGRNQNIKFEGQEIIAITINSSVAQALVNKKVGDKVNIKVPAGLRTVKIVEIG